ncbi:hypothetical protein PLUTE_a4293 [Pseudoalteromonas luteoviolacea DSM 6061]|nr:hypothetical protein [Pseudoalteromonas luteoviolacea DSM 6061]
MHINKTNLTPCIYNLEGNRLISTQTDANLIRIQSNRVVKRYQISYLIFMPVFSTPNQS